MGGYCSAVRSRQNTDAPMIQFREGRSDDGDGVQALRELAHPQGSPEKRRPDFWAWMLEQGYAGAGRFFVAEANQSIVGHLAFVPQRYEAGEARLRGALAVNAMTHPAFRRQKVFSRLAAFAAERVRDEFQIITAFQIRRAVLGGMQAGGWRAALRVPVLLRPLWGTSLIKDNDIRALKPSDWKQVDGLLSSANVRQPRSPEFLEWRYGRNPRWQYEMQGLFEGDNLRALVVHRETVLRGFRTMAIADAGLSAGSEELFRRLVGQACGTARSKGIALAAAFFSRAHSAYGALTRSGFFAGPHRFNLLLQVFDPTVDWVAEAPWSLSWGDTDHL